MSKSIKDPRAFLNDAALNPGAEHLPATQEALDLLAREIARLEETQEKLVISYKSIEGRMRASESEAAQ